jgi:hypothetical protein
LHSIIPWPVLPLNSLTILAVMSGMAVSPRIKS